MMPLSEFYSVVRGKHDPGQPKMTNCSPDQSPFVPEHEFVELLWENGHVVMQGQSNRPKRSSFPSAFPCFAGRTKEKELRDAVAPKASRYAATDAVGNGLQTTGPSGQIGLGGQDDELVPWLNCPIDDYCSEFFSEFSGVNPNSLPTAVPTDRISSFGQNGRDSHGLENGNGSRPPVGSSESSRMNNNLLFQFPQQCQTLSSSSRPKESDVTMGNAHQGPRGDLPATKVQKQDITTSKPMQPSNITPVMNFSHFSRPVALVKANLLNVDRVRGSEKASAAASNNPMESTIIESAGRLKSVYALHGQLNSVTAKTDLGPPVQPSREMAFVGHSDAICQEDGAKNSRNHKKTDNSSNRRGSDLMKCQDSNFKAIEHHETENRYEPAIASSSVCSANGGSAASSDIRNRAKRKCQEGEESEYPSEQEHEDDSIDVRKPVMGQSMGKKRSRAAEVHNLSERRRRDRINEKMRALQELIPHCNKVDKASMLDEAIEYLKTLQMQVQIMSMGSGLCVPPMMLPTGVQHIRAPHMGPFSPMGVGMGMGMGLGFGMGMLDMTRSPLVPIPRMHGPQYPCASIPGTAGHLQLFGIPGQTLPMSMPHPPPFVPVMGMTTNVNPVPEEPPTEVSPVQASDSAPPNSKDQQLNTLEQVTKTSTDSTVAESSRQANKE